MTLGRVIYQHEIESFLGGCRFPPHLAQLLGGVHARVGSRGHQFLACLLTYPPQMHPVAELKTTNSGYGPSVSLVPVVQGSGFGVCGVSHCMHRCPDFAQGTGKGLAAGLRDLVLEVRVLGLVNHR